MKKIELMEIEEREYFIDSVGHDLKTPLISIKGYSQLLTDERIFNDSEKRERYLKIIHQNADRLHEVIVELQIKLRK
jgi:signal transduction histidine kinase